MLATGDADLIHAHNGRTALLAAIAVRLARRGALVTTQHFLDPAHTTRRGWKAAVSRLAHRWVQRQTGQCIAVSDAAGKGMLSRNPGLADKLTVVPNGISAPDPDAVALARLRESLGLSSTAPMIACVARLEPEKDIRTLIDAMPRVIATVPEVRCVIAGEGSQRRILEDRICEAGLGANVILAGFIKDAPALIAAADLFVLPSRAEPFGLVLLEAMALGKATIATAAGGPLEIVDSGHTGLLVPPANPDALAAAIIRLLAEPDTRRSMGAQGRERFEQKFTAQTMGAATLEVYAKAANRSAASCAVHSHSR
jgi:glycosyltransferase involved in cell wall biosynthesis